jgi:hypothetical protein
VYRIRTSNGIHHVENGAFEKTTRRAQRGDGGKYMVRVLNVSDEDTHGAPLCAHTIRRFFRG